jgi:lactate dehydrogenase-like 2-hydroxyacid dehydrogenase
LTEACAELGVALILCTTRRLIEANEHVYSGEWKDWYPMYMVGRGLVDSIVGIVGMGRIGKLR